MTLHCSYWRVTPFWCKDTREDRVRFVAHDLNCVVDVNTVVVHGMLTDALAGVCPASPSGFARGIGHCMLAFSFTSARRGGSPM